MGGFFGAVHLELCLDFLDGDALPVAHADRVIETEDYID